MKKLFLLVSIIGLLIPLASAQTSFYACDGYSSVGEHLIVRSWDDGNAAITGITDVHSPNAFNTNFVYLDPYATNTYTTDIEYRKAEFFGSLTRVRNKHYLAAMGPRWFLKDKMMLGSYPNPTCPSTEAIKANILENYLEIDVSNILPYDNDSKPIIIDMSSVEQRTVSIICSNP